MRSELQKETLKLDRMQSVRAIRTTQGEDGKAILLTPEIERDDASTWSPKISELIESSQIDMVPYTLEIDYDYWTYHDIMSSILPVESEDDIPSGFSIIGHVAHLNLREQSLPYKYLIATVLLDKNPPVRTVINKIDDVGSVNVYRTFKYEVLAGEDDMNVEVSEQNCIYCFDYSKVYWNSRLHTEHTRLVEIFKPGEAICDVMAGVGPFAVPAAKKGCFVCANDLNPSSFKGLKDAVKRNKVEKYVASFNEDGNTFIRRAAQLLQNEPQKIDITPTTHQKRRSKGAGRSTSGSEPHSNVYAIRPQTFSHYVLNLPASALSFLPSFISLYAGQSHMFAPHTDVKLPMIHVYCFGLKSDDNTQEERRICDDIGILLDCPMYHVGEQSEGQGDDGVVEVFDVRDVAPLKRMFCASFRLPSIVAFREDGRRRGSDETVT